MSDATTAAPAATPLTGEAGVIARLASQKSKFKAAWQAVTGKVTELEKVVSDLTTENDKLKAQSDPTAASRQVEALTGQIRGMKARAAFDSAALKAGAQPAQLENLWKLSEVKVDADEPDQAAIAATITAQQAACAWAFGATLPPPDPNAPPPPRPGPGSGQGGASGASPQFTEAQLSDPKFVMANFEKISLAASERVARGEV